MSVMPETSAGSALIVVEERPFNAETTLTALGTDKTPTEDFYVRSNFDVPSLDASKWRLRVEGRVSRPIDITYADLLSMPSVETTLVVECAGNGRLLMDPPPAGTPWRLGAVGSAQFRGVSLRSVLERAGITDDAVEILFRGADGGEIKPGRNIRFERSLPVTEALRQDVLIGFEMNGEPLTPAHGFPARLIVPGYYGVAWVKWLNSIDVLAAPFDGYFQTERYVYRNDPANPREHPVTRMRVRAIVTSHASGARVRKGPIELSGLAWSGCAPVISVCISDDGGHTWEETSLAGEASAGTGLVWRGVWTPRSTGEACVLIRATDAAGNTQPATAVSNDLGYGNNVMQRLLVTVVS